jgi:hypothetical protein
MINETKGMLPTSQNNNDTQILFYFVNWAVKKPFQERKAVSSHQTFSSLLFHTGRKPIKPDISLESCCSA